MYEHTLLSCDLQWMPPKVCHFAVKSLPRGLVQRAKRANFRLKTCGILSAFLCFQNGRIGKSLWQQALEELSNCRSESGKPMVQHWPNLLTNHNICWGSHWSLLSRL